MRNDDVLRRTGIERELLEKRKIAYLGKVQNPQLANKQGKRSMGRKQMKWLRNLEEMDRHKQHRIFMPRSHK